MGRTRDKSKQTKTPVTVLPHPKWVATGFVPQAGPRIPCPMLLSLTLCMLLDVRKTPPRTVGLPQLPCFQPLTHQPFAFPPACHHQVCATCRPLVSMLNCLSADLGALASLPDNLTGPTIHRCPLVHPWELSTVQPNQWISGSHASRAANTALRGVVGQQNPD